MYTSLPISITFRLGSLAQQNGWTPSGNATSTYNGLRSNRTTDTLVRRTRPADLFLNSTARTTISELWNHGTFTWREGPYKDISYVYIGFPVINMYANYGVRDRYTTSAANVKLAEPVVSIDRNAMYNSIRSNLKNEATNLANMLGEYRETAQTFLDLAKIVSSRGKSLMKRHKTGVNAGKVSWKRTSAQGRLAWEYGVRPLANDMGTSIAELKSAIVAAPPIKEGVARRKTKNRNVGYMLPNSSIYSGRAQSDLTVELFYRTRWRAYMNQNALLLCLAEHGFLNPLGVAWELMPYSFVVDWWFNVGDVLSSLDNLLICNRLTVIDSKSTRYSEFITTLGNSNTLDVGSAFYHKRTDIRYAPADISVVATLAYKPSLSLGHILNGLALLYVAKGRFS